MKRENADYATERASARRRKRTREMRTFALLVCLVVMTAVLYLAVSIFSWIDGRMKDGEGAVLPVTGDGVENPDAAGSVSGGDASDGNQSADGSGGRLQLGGLFAGGSGGLYGRGQGGGGRGGA